jgi:alpha-tubulin suppressor-like RCC1 family protein
LSEKRKTFISFFRAMPVNQNHCAVLDVSGEHFLTCGKNDNGQLGTGDQQQPTSIITKVNLPVKFLAISAGSYHNIGIAQEGGSLWAWGSNKSRQLGISDTRGILPIPTQIPNTHSFVQVSAGGYFSLALDQNQSVWSFGYNDYGQLGLGDNTLRDIPTKIESLSNIKMISAGYQFGIALDHDGNMWSFGFNSHGELALGDRSHRNEPCLIESLRNVAQVACGTFHSLVVDGDSHVRTFGCNSHGALGLGDDKQDKLLPVQITGLDDIVEVYCGGHSSAVKNRFDNWHVFGLNDHSQLGIPHEQEILLPKLQSNWSGKQIFPGASHTVVMDEEGYISFFGILGNKKFESIDM